MMEIIVLLFTTSFGVLALPSPPKDDKNLNWRIIGGEDAPDGAYPYMAFIYPWGYHYCSGSILSKTIVLTTANCIERAIPSQISVVVGTNEWDSGDGISYNVRETRTHENYDARNLLNDIAILKVSSEIQFGEKVAPIKPGGSVVGSDENATLSGWGATNANGDINTKLQYITLRTISNDVCSSKLQHNICSSQICTFNRYGEGACYGDLGAPLVINNEQIGILSYGRYCAAGYPDIYTRVSSYIGWIAEHSY